MGVIFLCSLSGGMLAVLATHRVDRIAWKFIRLAGAIALALAVLAALWYAKSHGEGFVTLRLAVAGAVIILGGVIVVFLAPLAPRWPDLIRGVCLIAGLGGLFAAGSLVAVRAGGASATMQATMIAGRVLGGLMLGSITIAWLLGHAYLTATRMSIDPLRHFSRALSLAVIARTIFVAGSLCVAFLIGGNDAIAGRLVGSWLIMSLRVGVGLFAVGVFAYMVADCVRLRSTQSATGILYFGSIFTYIGELASQQLVADCGWPM